MNRAFSTKRLLVLPALILAAVFSTPAPASAAIAPNFKGWAYISGRPYVNVRACASLGCAIVGRRNADAPVYVTRTYGAWANIGYGRWVARSLIKPYGSVN